MLFEIHLVFQKHRFACTTNYGENVFQINTPEAVHISATFLSPTVIWHPPTFLHQEIKNISEIKAFF